MATKSAVVAYASPTLKRAASYANAVSVKQWGTPFGAEYIALEGKALGHAAGDSVTIANDEHTWTFTGGAFRLGGAAFFDSRGQSPLQQYRLKRTILK